MNRNDFIYNRNDGGISKAARILAAVLFLCMMTAGFAGCSSAGNDAGASEAAARDLEALRSSDMFTEVPDGLEGVLDEEGAELYREFLGKAGTFEYEIKDVSVSSSEADTAACADVTCRIVSYPFGAAYLEAWSDYIDSHGDSDFNEKEFYDGLVRNLVGTEDKAYVSEVSIRCCQEDNGGWTTDADNNYGVLNAVFGGMPAEMAALADS